MQVVANAALTQISGTAEQDLLVPNDICFKKFHLMTKECFFAQVNLCFAHYLVSLTFWFYPHNFQPRCVSFIFSRPIKMLGTSHVRTYLNKY
jgi:hypothetical protein